MNDLYREAQYRWLKPAEVLYILQNHENDQFSNEPPQLPPSGTLFLFNKRVLRFFRRDGHNWRKKKDQKTVGEAHERLKVGNVETLNCYYAHGEDNPNFQRRSYWMLDPVYEHIVLVHYRDINERKSSPGSIASASILNSSLHSTQNQGGASIMTDLQQNIFSPGSVEVSSEVVFSNNVSDHLQRVHVGEPISFEEGLQKLKLQLCLDDEIIKENDLFIGEDELSNSAGYSDFGAEMAIQQLLFLDDPGYSASSQLPPEDSGKKDHFSNFVVLQDENGATVGDEDSLLTEMLEPWVKPLSSSRGSTAQGKQGYEWSETVNDLVENFKIPAFPSEAEIGTNTECYQLFFDQSMPPEAPNLTVSQVQKYTIQEISPEWGYDSDATKVIIVGSFLCDPSVFSWTCMFGEVEVPVEIIKEGVLRCVAPPSSPRKVTICVTTANRESCSEIREFEYRAKSDICAQCKSTPSDGTTEELLRLVRFVQMLMCDSDSFNRIIEGLLDGTGASSQTTRFLLNALIKDKLHQWLSVRTKEGDDQKNGCSLSKKEQGIIHMLAALGFEWALNTVLDCGVNVNFRDINGWTALHWAARFGREKMVAALIASGAYAGAVTDPSKKDSTGKTAASIAASNGYKGLAGYLSEVSLTTHLSSLTLEECELSKGSAEVEAEQTIKSVSGTEILSNDDDPLSMKDTLAAVRNAAQAAARIQAAFRARSFRKRMQREGATGVTYDEYGISTSDMQAISRVASSSGRDYNLAALSIQKKYRGWKCRKDFLELRKKTINIQAHVRGYQVRKNYKVICWAVGVLDKVILRWRRKGIGLKNFLSERGSSEDSDDDEDILKLFRKQNMDRALDEAVGRVLSMVNSPDARQQYRRLLESYRRAKGVLKSNSSGASPSTSGDFTEDMVTS